MAFSSFANTISAILSPSSSMFRSSLRELRMLSMAETIISENAITNGVRSPLFKGCSQTVYPL